MRGEGLLVYFIAVSGGVLRSYRSQGASHSHPTSSARKLGCDPHLDFVGENSYTDQY